MFGYMQVSKCVPAPRQIFGHSCHTVTNEDKFTQYDLETASTRIDSVNERQRGRDTQGSAGLQMRQQEVIWLKPGKGLGHQVQLLPSTPPLLTLALFFGGGGGDIRFCVILNIRNGL